jgi:hypothetical protein
VSILPAEQFPTSNVVGTPTTWRGKTRGLPRKGAWFMPLYARKLATLALHVIAAAATLWTLCSVAQPRESGPFAALVGEWVGSGAVTADNRSERIRCKVSYGLGGDPAELIQNLVCASDSYRFDVASSIFANEGLISGQWSERTRGISGRLSGVVSANEIRARVEAQGFSASIDVSTRGDRQTVLIRPRAADVSSVSVSLRRVR